MRLASHHSGLMTSMTLRGWVSYQCPDKTGSTVIYVNFYPIKTNVFGESSLISDPMLSVDMDL